MFGAMRVWAVAVVIWSVSLMALPADGQTAVAPGEANATAAPAPMTRPSDILQGPLTTLQQALSGIRLEKWKMSGELRDAADGDLRSIERDFRDTLPPLLATADSEPGSVAKVLPAMRNVDALYDVALRVAAMGRLTAPAQQSAALDQALQGLASARKQVGDQVQQAAVAEEGRVGELQASLRASQAAAAAAANAPPAPAPVTKPVVKPKKKVRPKAATPAAGGAAPGTPATPPAPPNGSTKQP